jgi:hypothetical protein
MGIEYPRAEEQSNLTTEINSTLFRDEKLH